MSKISSIAEELARPLVEEKGFILWDTEFVREAGSWYLRIYIDKEDGVSIDDCVMISRLIDPVLDEKDFIPESYTFEVCSAGADRVLKRQSDFDRFIGSQVDLSLYQPLNGSKAYTGILISHSSDVTSIESGGQTVTFDNKAIAQVRLHIDFNKDFETEI